MKENVAELRFERLIDEGVIAAAYYRVEDGKVVFIHAEVPTDSSIQLLLGHTKLESTVRYLGIEVEDTLEMTEQTDI